MQNKIQNKIYEYHATIIDNPELAKRNQAKMKAMAEKHGNYLFHRMHESMEYRDMSYQQAVDDCWRFYDMEPKECGTCKHDGNQMVFRSGCTGCFANRHHEHYEPKHV